MVEGIRGRRKLLLSVLEIFIVTKVAKKHAESVLPVVEGFLGYNF